MPRLLYKTVLLLCLLVFTSLFTTPGISAQASFPLECRGGGKISFRFSHARDTITVGFKPGTKPSGQGLVAGECSWRDRGFRPGEPPFICHRGITQFDIFWGDNPTTVIAQSNQALWYLGALRNPNAFVTFNVFNEGSCMRVV
jgi:hypothetical protein